MTVVSNRLGWAEVLATLSLAADHGMAMPIETGLANCLVALRLAERRGVRGEELERVYRLALLQHIGCTSSAAVVADALGDELLMREHALTLDFTDQRAMLRFLIAHVGRANPPLARPAALGRALVKGRGMNDLTHEVCEAGRMLSGRCGYPADAVHDLDAVYEYWDGSGFPGVLSEASLPMPVRMVQAASLFVAAHHEGGEEAVRSLLTAARSKRLDPVLVDELLADLPHFAAPLTEVESLWDAVIAADPSPSPAALSDDEIDDALRAFADFVDLKSPYLVGHSSGVADLAAVAAREAGLNEDDARTVRRAGWLHDVGRIGVSAGVWGRAGPLRPDDWEKVRLHAYLTDRLLSRSPYLATLGSIASAHHERTDGTGYHRGRSNAELPMAARLLAAADCYHAMTEPRPHRAALPPDVAAKELRSEVGSGHLDAAAVEAVLAAAGHRLPRADRPGPTLTAREREVLVEIARGKSIKQIARDLVIAPKTADGHIQRIYAKLGVSTRAGATLYAMQHGLL